MGRAEGAHSTVDIHHDTPVRDLALDRVGFLFFGNAFEGQLAASRARVEQEYVLALLKARQGKARAASHDASTFSWPFFSIFWI